MLPISLLLVLTFPATARVNAAPFSAVDVGVIRSISLLLVRTLTSYTVISLYTAYILLFGGYCPV